MPDARYVVVLCIHDLANDVGDCIFSKSELQAIEALEKLRGQLSGSEIAEPIE